MRFTDRLEIIQCTVIELQSCSKCSGFDSPPCCTLCSQLYLARVDVECYQVTRIEVSHTLYTGINDHERKRRIWLRVFKLKSSFPCNEASVLFFYWSSHVSTGQFVSQMTKDAMADRIMLYTWVLFKHAVDTLKPLPIML